MSLLELMKTPAARMPRVPEGAPDIIDLPDPDEVIIPLEYPGQILFMPLVQAGDTVARNQAIGRSELGNCVHASIGGEIKEIRTIWTARGYHVPAVVIAKSDVPDLTPEESLSRCGLDPSSATRLELLKACGVISPWTTPGRHHCESCGPEAPPIRHIVVKGINEEPTINNFELLLKERAEDLREGLRRLPEIEAQAKIWLTVPRKLVDWARDFFGDGIGIVGVKNDYRERIEAVVVPRVTGVAMATTHPFRDYGVAVLSVECLLNAIDGLQGVPVVRKTVTISGGPLAQPVTVRTAVGTTTKALLASQGLDAADFGRVVIGGPMKGYAQYTDETPLSKFQHGVYLLEADALPSEVNLTCINCGNCARACPNNIQVHLIGRYVEHGLLNDVARYHPEVCHECGLCAFVCPSHRPLVQLVKMAKKYGG